MYGFCPLASGSSGNSIYFGSKKTKILIDLGISVKELKKRLNEIDVKIEEIQAILITHDHMDHIAGLKTLINNYDIPIITNSETAKGIYSLLKIEPRFKIFTTGEEFEFEDLKVFPFSIQHDTLDPVGYIIEFDDIKIGFCTDLGFVTTLVKNALIKCNYLYLESNHDVNMLLSSNRPEYLKKRILSRQGHLSNDESNNLLQKLLHPNLKHIFLAHLSEECNSQEKAYKLVQELLEKNNNKTKLSIAYQDKVSEKVFF